MSADRSKIEIWSGQQFALAAHEIGFPAESINVRDQSYRPVRKAHMLGEHYDYVAQQLKRRGLLDWDEDWDCDDFTMFYVLESHIAHRQAQRSIGMLAQSEMTFECWIAGIEHAVACCFESPRPNQLKAFFIESQPNTQRRELHLTTEQIKTCTLLK